MTNFQKLLLKSEDTPMDVAESAAIRKLIEWDDIGKTEFHDDDPVRDTLKKYFKGEKEIVYDIQPI